MGPPPDVELVHQLDLLVDHLALVLLVVVRDAVQVEVLRVDRIFVDELVLLGGEGPPRRQPPAIAVTRNLHSRRLSRTKCAPAFRAQRATLCMTCFVRE